MPVETHGDENLCTESALHDTWNHAITSQQSNPTTIRKCTNYEAYRIRFQDQQ